MTTRPRTPAKIIQAAWVYENHVGPLVAAALDVLARERATGYPSSTRADGLPRGSSESTSVERALESRTVADEKIDTILDDINAITSLIDSLGRVCRNVVLAAGGASTARDEPLCSSAGRDGATEWDKRERPCEDRPVKSGLCAACYAREYRWRKSKGLSVRDVEAGAA